MDEIYFRFNSIRIPCVGAAEREYFRIFAVGRQVFRQRCLGVMQFG